MERLGKNVEVTILDAGIYRGDIISITNDSVVVDVKEELSKCYECAVSLTPGLHTFRLEDLDTIEKERPPVEVVWYDNELKEDDSEILFGVTPDEAILMVLEGNKAASDVDAYTVDESDYVKKEALVG